MPGRDAAFVTVVVPFFEQTASLARCLEALARQRYAADRHEILVVDNGEQQNGARLDLGRADGGAPRRTLHEPRQSSYAARNAGAAAARGEILAFTDADCVPAPDWIERGVEALRRHPEAAIVAGRVDVTFADPSALSLIDQFEALLSFEQRDWVERRGYGATANLFVRAEALRAAGGFDARLRSRGDEELCRRVRASGGRIAYCDEAAVTHPARRTFAELVRRSRRLAGGAAGLEQLGRSRGARPFVAALGIARELVPPLRFAARVAASPQVRGAGRKAGLVLLLVLLRWTSAVERARLAFGGEPLR